MRLKIIAVLALMVLGVGAAAFVLFDPPTGGSAASQYLTAQATRTNVVEQSVATGSVSAHATYGLAFGRNPALVPSGSTSSGASNGTTTWIVSTVGVKVGDQVTQGSVLASADATDAQVALQIAQANLTAAQAKLTQDQDTPTSTTKVAAQNSLKQAQQQLTNARQSRTDSLRQNSLTLANAQKALSTARSQLATDKAASAASAVITADKNAVASALQQLKSTQAQVTASNHQSAQSVGSATLALSNAKNNYKTSVAPATSATIASDKASVASAQQAVDTAQTTVDGAKILAPADGTVVAVNLVVGLAAASGDAIQIETGPMEVTAAFAESDLPTLKVGQPADITVTALGQDVTGKVSEIVPTAASSGSSNVVTYNVTVTMDSNPPSLASGMSASVAITTASATGVIAVPAIALVGSSGNYGVRTLDSAGQAQAVAVQVGLVTSSLAEIQSGLTEGETVIVGSSTARQGTTTTTGGFGGIGGGIPVGGGGTRFVNGGTGR